ncbi:MAG: aminotransferase class IV [Algisphaera sp.]
MDIYLNGQFHAPDAAHVAITDAGLQHAVGLFETFQVHHGKAFRLDAHLARLAESATALGLAPSLATAPLADAVAQTIAHNHIDRARLRLTLTAGSMSLLKPADSTSAPQVRQTVSIVASEPTVYAPEFFDRGIVALIHGPAANPFDETAGRKTLNYWERLRSLRRAASAGAGEALWLNVSNHLASGAVSNLLLVKDGTLLSPFARGEEVKGALPAPVLPGVTRAAVFECAKARSIDVVKRMLTVDDLLTADEVFLTNSGWGVLPVTTIEKHVVGSGDVGPMTANLRADYLALIERETS